MTGCDKFNELLSAAIDGEITPDEEKELISHMEACNECSSLFESLRVLSNEFSDMLIDPPEALLSGIMEKIKNRGQMDRRKFGKKRFFMMGGRLAAAAAVIVLVLFAADTFGTSRKSPAEKEMPADYAMKTAEEDSCDVPENESSLKYDEEYTRNEIETEDSEKLAESDDTSAVYGTRDGEQTGEGYSEDNGGEQEGLGAAAPGEPPEASGESLPEEGMLQALPPQPSTGFPAVVQFELNAKAKGIWEDNQYGSSGYYCVSIISGSIPEQLNDCELIVKNGGELHYLVPRNSIEQLNEEKRISEIFYDNLDAEYGIVVVSIPMS